MKRKIIGILLSVSLVLSLVPMAAFAGAENTYSVWIDGIRITDSNKADVLGEADGSAATVIFDPQTNTLTLNGASIAMNGKAKGFSNGIAGIKSELDALNIKLIGNNQIGKFAGSEATLDDFSCDVGITGTGDLNFSGDNQSSLTIYDYQAGIVAKNISFGENFKGKLIMRDCGGMEPQPPCVMNAMGTFDDHTFEYIKDGNIALLGGTFDLMSYQSNGMAASGSITIKNANVTLDTDEMALETRFGDVTIKDASFNASGNGAIYCEEGNVLIDNTKLKAVSHGCEAIDGNKEIILKNCPEIDINGADEALYAAKASIINCSKVKLESNELSTVNADDIFIENSTLDIKANHKYTGLVSTIDEYYEGTGTGNITIKDSKVTINAEGDGIKCNSLSISGGKTEIYSIGDTDMDGKGCGAHIFGDESAISITEANVKFTGGEAGIKFEATPKSGIDPYTGSLPKASFKGNTAFDTFTSMQEVCYKSEEKSGTFSEFAYIGNEMAKSLMIPHIHNIIKADGIAPTRDKSGFKNYYECSCGKCYEDADGKIEISDIEKWKAEGGNGYLPPLGGSPETGDSGNMALWMALISFAGIAFFALERKRSKAR